MRLFLLVAAAGALAFSLGHLVYVYVSALGQMTLLLRCL